MGDGEDVDWLTRRSAVERAAIMRTGEFPANGNHIVNCGNMLNVNPRIAEAADQRGEPADNLAPAKQPLPAGAR